MVTVVLDPFGKAARDLWRPHVLLMVAAPVVFATVLWMFIGWLVWGHLTGWINELLLSTRMAHWMGSWAAGTAQFTATLIALAMLAPGFLITAMVITEFITMPALVNHVATRYYPALARLHGGTVAGSVFNTTVAITTFILLWMVTLPLWFTGIGAIFVPLLNSAYLNQRVFRYDAISEHASGDELRTVIAQNRPKLYLLGLLLAVFYYIPLVNLLAPALSGLAFAHFQLKALAALRAKNATQPALN